MGRPKGSPNVPKLQAITKRIEALGMDTALGLLLSVMVNEKNEMIMRMDAAKSLLPYMHKKQPVATEIELMGSVNLIERLNEVYGLPKNNNET
jgi:hypothetical protein